MENGALKHGSNNNNNDIVEEKVMPLTAAEKQKKYREKLKKENLEKYKETQRKAKERSARYYEKKRRAYTEEDKQQLRQKWKEDRRIAKDLQMAPQNEPSTSQALNSKQDNQQLICLNMHRRVKYRLNQQNAQLQSQINALSKTLKNLQKKVIRQQKKLDKMQEYCDNVITKLNTEKIIEDLIHKQELEEKTPRKRVTEFINNIIPNIETPKKEEIIKKLLEHDVLTESLKLQFRNANNNEKKVLKKVLDNKIIKKYKQKSKIRTSLGFKSNFKNYTPHKTKTITLQKKIECFFNRDDVSRATAGKKEYRTLKKVIRQKRYLLDKLIVLHKKFNAEEAQVSFSTFKKYRPFYVLSPKIKDCESCACIKHSNMQFLVDELKRHNTLKNDNLNEVTADLVCDFNSKDCMYNNCSTCIDRNIKVDHEKLLDKVSWFSWVLKEHEYEKQGEKKKIKKMIKLKKDGTLKELLEIFCAGMRTFKTHIFNFYYQYKKYKDCINNLKDNEVCVHVDFSENFTCKYHQEIQAMHFIKEQITLHTGVIYIKGEKKPISFCSISPDNKHSPEAIWAHLDPVLKYIKITYPNICTIHFFSDGPTTQYRQKKNFYLFSDKIYEYGFNHGTWSFFEAAHGKGAADGVGGAIKRTLDTKIAQGKDIPNAETAFDVLKSEDTCIKLFYVPSIMKSIDAKLNPLPQTMKIHQLVAKEKLQLRHRYLSCFCGDPRGSCECHSPAYHSFPPIMSTNENQSNKQKNKEIELKSSTNSEKIRRRRRISLSSEEDDNEDSIVYAESDASAFLSDDSKSPDYSDDENNELDEKTGIIKPKIGSNKKVTPLCQNILKQSDDKYDIQQENKKMSVSVIKELKVERLSKSTEYITQKDDETNFSQKRKIDPKKKVTVLSQIIIKKPDAGNDTKHGHKRKILCENEELMPKKYCKSVANQILSTGKDGVTLLPQIRNALENTASYDLSNVFKNADTINVMRTKDTDKIKTDIKESYANKENKNYTKRETKTTLKDKEKDNDDTRYTETDGIKQDLNDARLEDTKEVVIEPYKEMDRTGLDEKRETQYLKSESCNKSKIEEDREAIENEEYRQNDHILNLNESIIVRYYQRNTWKYFVGFIENIEFKEGENYYKVKFLKTVKDSFSSVKFLVQRKLDIDIVANISIVKKVNLIQRAESSKVYYLSNDSDLVFF